MNNLNWVKIARHLTILALLWLPMAASALDLQQAKTQGLVGEMHNGYLATISKSNTKIEGLIADINRKRKAKYQEIANSNKVTLSQIESRAGQNAINRTTVGNYIKPKNKAWQKK
mgnify:CR=1 FL=1|tara:strand:+ start:978 stop:1322 length:345 start_codon:yes stop_codon:yes gene_type:complete